VVCLLTSSWSHQKTNCARHSRRSSGRVRMMRFEHLMRLDRPQAGFTLKRFQSGNKDNKTSYDDDRAHIKYMRYTASSILTYMLDRSAPTLRQAHSVKVCATTSGANGPRRIVSGHDVRHRPLLHTSTQARRRPR
jgi:hypothetical protein